MASNSEEIEKGEIVIALNRLKEKKRCRCGNSASAQAMFYL
jgi:hypothetical protein